LKRNQYIKVKAVLPNFEREKTHMANDDDKYRETVMEYKKVNKNLIKGTSRMHEKEEKKQNMERELGQMHDEMMDELI
jgi:hypothetical protein